MLKLSPGGEIFGEDCVKMDSDTGLYHDVSCDSKNCFLCQFRGDKMFKLKGLCLDQDFIDTKYAMVLSNEQFTFRGLFGRTNITLNKLTNNWEIISHVPYKTHGNLIGFSNLFPLGLETWYLGIDCVHEIETYNKHELKLTRVIILNYFL